MPFDLGGCPQRGWFAVDELTMYRGQVSHIAFRAEQDCGPGVAIRAAVRWTAPPIVESTDPVGAERRGGAPITIEGTALNATAVHHRRGRRALRLRRQRPPARHQSGVADGRAEPVRRPHRRRDGRRTRGWLSFGNKPLGRERRGVPWSVLGHGHLRHRPTGATPLPPTVRRPRAAIGDQGTVYLNVPVDATTATVSGLSHAVDYVPKVVYVSPYGEGRTGVGPPVRAAIDLGPFASVAALVSRQYLDFGGTVAHPRRISDGGRRDHLGWDPVDRLDSADAQPSRVGSGPRSGHPPLRLLLRTPPRCRRAGLLVGAAAPPDRHARSGFLLVRDVCWSSSGATDRWTTLRSSSSCTRTSSGDHRTPRAAPTGSACARLRLDALGPRSWCASPNHPNTFAARRPPSRPSCSTP